MEFEGIELAQIPPYRGVFAGVAAIDKHLAEILLKHNTRNRPLRETKAGNIARAMRLGNWQFNGEAIKFDRDGVLADGQHRLQAITMLDGEESFDMLVLFGLTPESQLTMDQGAKRGAHEQLALTGADVDSTITAAIRILIRWEEGMLFGDQVRNGKVSTDDVVRWHRANIDAVDRFREFGARGYRRIMSVPPSISLAVAYRFHEIDEEWASEFFNGLLTPVGLREGSAVLALRGRLERIALAKEKVSERDTIAYLVMAWNAFRDCRQISKVQGPRGGTWTRETFPEPK
jgi:hypothetical protein